MFILVRTDSDNTDFVELVRLLDADLAERDGEDHAFYAQYNKITAIRNVVVAYHNEVAVGCGAFKKYAEGVAEVKRMYVRPDYRRQGIARIILNELEKWSAEAGYQNLILETGKAQPEAIALYTASGYKRTPNYGQYEHIENSVCMKKDTIIQDELSA
jgi:GNAT superfamily N-acetyltransferase